MLSENVLRKCIKGLAALTILICFNLSALEDADDPNTIDISVGDLTLTVAYADEDLERQLGLMYRRAMCDNCGMLFKFDSVRIASIWMKNTYIPLDLAYIDEDGLIIDIQPLTPHDLTSVRSPKPVLYALEMNQGWFGKNNIKVGDTLVVNQK